MLGRRGPVQAAFTPPELKELGELAGADVIVDPRRPRARSRRASASSRPIASAPGATSTSCGSTRRARRRAGRAASSCGSSPRRSRSSATSGSKAYEIVRNELVEENGRIVARPTGETELIPAGLVLRSVGYKGVALPGVPFDESSGDDPERRRPRRGRRAHLRRRLDQARPERRHRHEQEGRDRDGRAAARGRARGPAEPRECGLDANARGAARGARRRATSSTPAGRRSTPPSGAPASRSDGPRVKLRTWEKLLQTGRKHRSPIT